jgi:hypothetical protein
MNYCLLWYIYFVTTTRIPVNKDFSLLYSPEYFSRYALIFSILQEQTLYSGILQTGSRLSTVSLFAQVS